MTDWPLTNIIRPRPGFRRGFLLEQHFDIR
jgi:hypothetical protein